MGTGNGTTSYSENIGAIGITKVHVLPMCVEGLKGQLYNIFPAVGYSGNSTKRLKCSKNNIGDSIDKGNSCSCHPFLQESFPIMEAVTIL
jgi:hypothetical protein